MLSHFLSQTAFLGKITSSCSAVPAKSTMSPILSLQRQQETPQQCISCISWRCAASQWLPKLSKYFLSSPFFGTNHPTGDSAGSLRAWLMVMYAPRKYTLAGNEQVRRTTSPRPLWCATSDSPRTLGEHLTATATFLLARHKTETQNLF